MHLLPENEYAVLEESLYFLHVAELKELIHTLGQENSSNTKLDLIKQILYFFKTGVVLKKKQFPIQSKAQKGVVYTLEPHTLMLKGSYKNDHANRAFFKKLIGPYFHFTAYGIDWLNERWYAGNPPTYQEFADMWQHEYEYRKIHTVRPKDEWAYINFAQEMLKKYPDVSKEQILLAWKNERLFHVKKVYEIVRAYKQKLKK